MPTVTNGGATSGNSSVLSLNSAKMPKTTSATIATTVMSGRLIAKSEMNMDRLWRRVGRRSCQRLRRIRGALTFTGVFSEMPRAAPSRIVSPACNAAFESSTVSVAASRMPELHFRLLHDAVLDAASRTA